MTGATGRTGRAYTFREHLASWTYHRLCQDVEVLLYLHDWLDSSGLVVGGVCAAGGSKDPASVLSSVENVVSLSMSMVDALSFSPKRGVLGELGSSSSDRLHRVRTLSKSSCAIFSSFLLKARMMKYRMHISKRVRASYLKCRMSYTIR